MSKNSESASSQWKISSKRDFTAKNPTALSLLRRFYCEELYRVVHLYPRNILLSTIILVARPILIILVTLSGCLSEIIESDSNISFLNYFESSNADYENAAVWTFFTLNLILVFFIFTKLSIFIFKESTKSSQNSTSPQGLAYTNVEEELKVERRNLISSICSFFLGLYPHVILIPCLYFTARQRSDIIGVVNTALSFGINLLVSDSDYGYQIHSFDRLGRNFGYFQFLFSAVVDPTVFRVFPSEPSHSNLIGGIYLISSILVYLYDSIYYDKRSSFAKIWSESFGAGVCFLMSVVTNFSIKRQVFAFIVLLMIPFTWRISNLIINWIIQSTIDGLQSCGQRDSKGELTKIGVNQLDRMIRVDLFGHIEYARESDAREIQLLNMILNNLDETYVGSNDSQQKSKTRKEIIQILKSQIISEIWTSKRRSSIRDVRDIAVFLIFLLEIAQAPRLYWMIFLETIRSKRRSLKQLQIIHSINGLFFQQRGLLRRSQGSANTFNTGLIEVIIFEKLLKESYSTFAEAVRLKVVILNQMKQRQILSSALIESIELLQEKIESIRKNLNGLLKMNDDSSDLLNLQILFLENLAFTEKDLRMSRSTIKRDHILYRSRQDHDSESSVFARDRFDDNTCIVFASYDQTRKLQIRNVSNNFTDIFYQNYNKDAIEIKIESIIPEFIQPHHPHYVSNYLEEELSSSDLIFKESSEFEVGESQKKRKGEYNLANTNMHSRFNSRMSDKIIFASITKVIVIPVRIELRVNELPLTDMFGITAKIKREPIQREYIIFDESTLNVLGITEKVHYKFYPQIEQLSKIHLQKYFPFLTAPLGDSFMKYESIINSSNAADETSSVIPSKAAPIVAAGKKKKTLGFLIISIDDPYAQSTMVSANTQTTTFSKRSQKTYGQNRLSSLPWFSKGPSQRNYDFSFFQFIYVEMQLKKINYNGIENCSYFEIKKIKTINPKESASFILSHLDTPEKRGLYSKLLSQTDINKIISELQGKATQYHSNDISESSLINFQSHNDDGTTIVKQHSYPAQDAKQLSDHLKINRQVSSTEVKEIIEEDESSVEAIDGREQTHNLGDQINPIDVHIEQILKYQDIFPNRLDSLQVDGNQLIINNEEHDRSNIQDVSATFHQDMSQNGVLLQSQSHQKTVEKQKRGSNTSVKGVSLQAGVSFFTNIVNQAANVIGKNNNINAISPKEKQSHQTRNNNIDNRNSQEILSPLTSPEQKYIGMPSNILSPTQNLMSPALNILSPTHLMYQQASASHQQLIPTIASPQHLKFDEYSQAKLIRSDKTTESQKKERVKRNIANSNKIVLKMESATDSIENNNYVLQRNREGISKNEDDNQQFSGNYISQSNKWKNNSSKVVDLMQRYDERLAKKKQVEEIQHDIASTNSKDSSCASAKRQLQTIMADKSTLSVIKAINLIGLICFATMIGITWVQFLQISSQISSQHKDYQVFEWPTKYQSTLSLIFKNQNILYMSQDSYLSFASDARKTSFRTRINQEMIDGKDSVRSMIAEMERASSDRQVFSLLRDHYFNFQIGKLYDSSIISTTSSVPSKLVAVEVNSTIQHAIIMAFQHVYRYSAGVGKGRPEYYMIQNQLSQISNLKEVQTQMLTIQQENESVIQDSLLQLMLVIILITAVCIGAIIPLFYYIQKQRDTIVQLFGTFSTAKIDQILQIIAKSYMQSQKQTNSGRSMMPASLKSLESLKDVRKQNISSVSSLPRFNSRLIIIALISFILIICYPIANKIVLQTFLSKSSLDLQTMIEVYQLRSFMLENIAMYFNVITMKLYPSLKPQQPSIYYSYMEELTNRNQEFNEKISWLVEQQYSESRYSQQLYDDFFFQVIKNDLCATFQKYPQYNVNATKINSTTCSTLNEGFLQKGLQVSYKKYLSIFPDLLNILEISDTAQSRSELLNYLVSFDIEDFTQFQETLENAVISLKNFVLDTNTEFYQDIQLFSIILIIYQMILMTFVFLIGWMSFSSYLNSSLHKTKTYLQIIDINSLIDNTYILTYIKKNSTI